MQKTTFTKEQISELRANPYTEYVSEKTIRFTPMFKNEFWYLYTRGISPSKIFRQLGYNPETLGQYRISNFAYKLSRKMEERTNLSTTERERDLQSQVDALRFELDSLKKIIIREDIGRRKR
ncbi:hypothetical protein IM774_09725 [Erysipelotrichaceae bacterium RD49]|nr:hypothetical protein [Erysipelotrichaceae bacterium RD49]